MSAIGEKLEGEKSTTNGESGDYEGVQRVYSWQQVAEHNTEDSCWVIFDENVYDISSWLPLHPGGRDVLLLSSGRDITDMMTSYHPFTNKPQIVLRRYLIGQCSSEREHPTYEKDNSGFYKELCLEVKKYFDTTGLHYKDPIPGAWRLALILLSFVLLYAMIFVYTDRFSLPVRLVAAAAFGVLQALPLLHTMHDASHGAIGTSPTVWSFLGAFTLDWMAGGSINSWHHQHIVGHHLQTNVHGTDPDLPACVEGDFRRVSVQQVWSWMYRYQWLYLPVLYCLLAVKVRFQDISETLVSRRSGAIRVRHISPSMILQQLLSKSLWVVWRIAIPNLVFHIPLLQVLLLTAVIEFSTGIWLAYNFQVSHISPLADFPVADASNRINREWAVCQVRSSVDYAHGSWLVTFLSGALNYQTVHHLFPSISQYHYPAIAPIVMEVCRKYNVKFNVLPSFRTAFSAHLDHLYQMGFKAHIH